MSIFAQHYIITIEIIVKASMLFDYLGYTCFPIGIDQLCEVRIVLYEYQIWNIKWVSAKC